MCGQSMQIKISQRIAGIVNKLVLIKMQIQILMRISYKQPAKSLATMAKSMSKNPAWATKENIHQSNVQLNAQF